MVRRVLENQKVIVEMTNIRNLKPSQFRSPMPVAKCNRKWRGR